MCVCICVCVCVCTHVALTHTQSHTLYHLRLNIEDLFTVLFARVPMIHTHAHSHTEIDRADTI